jgi:hypothetical protein
MAFEAYDIARTEQQKKDMLDSLKDVYRKVKAVETTTEADPKEFSWTIYVDTNTVIIRKNG